MDQEQIKVQDYVIHLNRILGKGQYGTVFEVSHPVHKKVCAKILNTSSINQKLLNREKNIVEGLKGINNENLVMIYDIINIEEKQELYIIMEQCKGGDLKSDIQYKQIHNQCYTVDEILNILRQLVNGYSKLYEKKIIHRDLKPANILIENGRVMITGFEVGTEVEDMTKKYALIKVGTPAYASPQLYFEPNYSSKSDVYSLGVILYQLTYLNLPFRGKTQKELTSFLKNLKTQPFKCEQLPEFYRTQDQNKAKQIVELIERMLLYSEDERISWQELIQQFVVNQRNQNINTIQIQNNQIFIEKQQQDSEVSDYELKQCLNMEDTIFTFKQQQDIEDSIFILKQQQTIEDSIFILKEQQTRQQFDATIFKQLYKVDGQITRIFHIIQILLSKAKLAQQVENAISSFIRCYLPYFHPLSLYLLLTSVSGYQYKILQNAYGFAFNNPDLIFKEMRKEYNLEAISVAMKQFNEDQSKDSLILKEQISQLMDNVAEHYQYEENTLVKIAYGKDISQYQKFFQLIKFIGNTDFTIYLKWFSYFYSKLLKEYLNAKNVQNLNFDQIKTLALILKFLKVDEEFPYQKYMEQIPQDIFLKENPTQQELLEISKKFSQGHQ